ncbi:MAG: lysylphosphatidylglycerol synthase transmembrane domain-containing protein [Bacteroidetes bacterium]|nr:lysylphosphatidylglycerol synthase transmembrane domain-containing protein [Bacteroidota bacterium]
MNRTSTRWTLRIGSFLIAALLMWLALRGVDFDAMASTFREANYWWLLPMAAVTFLSHWFRAARWAYLLDVSPRSDGLSPTRPVSRSNTFVSVIVGYMANYAGPRLGELIKTGNVARYERMHFTTVFGTVVVERILDMVTFALLLLTVPIIFSDSILELTQLLMQPVMSSLESTPTWLVLLGLGLITLGTAWFLRFLVRGLAHPESRIGRMADDFRQGFLSLARTGRAGRIVLQTLAMWICYGFMAWLPFVLLGQNDLFGIGPFAAWGIMLIGAVGVIIPSPGGIGTYHFITIQSLSLLFAMPQEAAASYALLTHTGQMLLYIVSGFLGMLFLGDALDVGKEENQS